MGWRRLRCGPRHWPQRSFSLGPDCRASRGPRGQRGRALAAGGCARTLAGSADQRFSGSAVDGAPTEEPRPDASNARRQRPATKGNWRVPCSCMCVKHPWLPTGVLHCPGHPSCAGAYISLANKLMRYGVDTLPHVRCIKKKKRGVYWSSSTKALPPSS
jgi:hypothetical protein